MTQVSGATAVVTGGASGLGRLMAMKLSARGARVALWDLQAERMACVAEEIQRTTGQPVHAYRCDISDRQEVYAQARRLRDEVGPATIVIHSAGVVTGRPFLECSDEQLQRTMAVNTLGMFWIYKAFLPEMVQRGEGHLVTIASAAGMVGVPKLADYCASKWAAIGFDEAMRNELRGLAPGVRTTIVCPYYVDTGMFEGVKTRFRWLLPILKGEDVAARVLGAIERNRARVWMPWFVYTAPLLRFLLPVRLFDATGHFLGITRSMEDFVGRSSPEERGP